MVATEANLSRQLVHWDFWWCVRWCTSTWEEQHQEVCVFLLEIALLNWYDFFYATEVPKYTTAKCNPRSSMVCHTTGRPCTVRKGFQSRSAHTSAGNQLRGFFIHSHLMLGPHESKLLREIHPFESAFAMVISLNWFDWSLSFSVGRWSCKEPLRSAHREVLPNAKVGEAPEQFKSRDLFKPLRSHSGLVCWIFDCALEDLHKF